MSHKLILLIALLFSFSELSYSQDPHFVDSLKSQLLLQTNSRLESNNKPDLSDTNSVKILLQLSRAYWGSNPDTAIEYAKQCLALAEQIGFKKGIGNAYNSMGVINNIVGEYPASLKFHSLALEIRKEINDREGIAWSNNNMGEDYRMLGNYPEALKHYLVALKLFEETGLKKGIASSYGNIAGIYNFRGNQSEALKYYFNGLKMMEEIGDKQGISVFYNNIGFTYEIQGEYSKALENYSSSLKIKEEIGDKNGIAYSYFNFGSIRFKQQNYSEALKNHLTALKIREEIHDQYGIAGSYISIGNVYFMQRNLNEASQYLNDALTLSKDIGSLEDIRDCLSALASLDSARGDFKTSLFHYKQFIVARDSLTNNENTKKLTQQEMQFDFDKKESLAKAEQEKRDAISKAEIGKQKTIRNLILVIIFLLLVSGAFAFNRYRISLKVKEEKMRLNVMVKTQEEERKHMARNLHDDVGVQLSTVKLFISSLDLENKNNDAEKLRSNSIDIINSSINDIRDILVNLSPKSLTEHGYITATEELVNKINKSNSLKFSLSIFGITERLEQSTEVALFRITQELINNTIKHAEATEVSLEIILRDGKIILLYEDNGKGYKADKEKQGYGLTNIITRTALLNGTVDFDTNTGNGTHVHIEIPYSGALVSAQTKTT